MGGRVRFGKDARELSVGHHRSRRCDSGELPDELGHFRFARIGSQPDEALARLQAAEALLEAGRAGEARAELEPAVEFFRRVGASRYVREAEALLMPL